MAGRAPAVGVRQGPAAAVRGPRRRGARSVGSGRRSWHRVAGSAWPGPRRTAAAAPGRSSTSSCRTSWPGPGRPEFVGRIGINLAGPDADGPRHRGAEGPVAAEDPRRRGDVVPALQRARRGERPRQRHDEGHPGRRRVGPQRPEGVDVVRPVRRLGGLPGPHRSRRARSTRASRTSWSTCTLRASRCGRSCSSPARPSSTRCTSLTRSSQPTHLIGPENEGWRVANSTLSHERGTNPRQLVIHIQLLEELLKLAVENGALDDVRAPAAAGRGVRRGAPVPAPQPAQHQPAVQGPRSRSRGQRAQALLERDEQATARHRHGGLGDAAPLWREADHNPGGGEWQRSWLYYQASSVWAGTNEIQRTILGERVLGLPRPAKATA